jgi:hypothetical protein
VVAADSQVSEHDLPPSLHLQSLPHLFQTALFDLPIDAMAPTPKAPTASGARKKDKVSKIVTLKLSPKVLKRFNDEPIKVESPLKEDSTSAAPVPLPASASSTSSTANNPSDPAPNTPAAGGTPVPSLMLPPTEGVKKKGGKRSSGAAGLTADGVPKVRGKPGPKKKARL